MNQRQGQVAAALAGDVKVSAHLVLKDSGRPFRRPAIFY